MLRNNIIELILYMGLLIFLCYILDYAWIKSQENFRDLKKSYREYKEAKNNLKYYLDK